LGSDPKGLSQEELAFRAGIDRSYISMLENGAYSATVTMLGKLARALAVEPAAFLAMGRSRPSP
jgi:transcriptional regulator with XRE-family HTH domain